MAVLVDCTTVLIRIAAIEARFPGGMIQFERQCPTPAHCSDGTIFSGAFMDPADAQAFVAYLEDHGFRVPEEVVLAQPGQGALMPCKWLGIRETKSSTPEGEKFTATIAWVLGEEPTNFVAHPVWELGQQTTRFERAGEYEFVGRRGPVDEYRHRESGEAAFVGRPDMPGPNIRGRFARLAEEIKRLEAGDFETEEQRQHYAITCHEKATLLVKDAGPDEAGPQLLLCIAARHLENLEEMERMARRVTELAPDLISGWLELTAALGQMERFEEAEASGRRAVELCPDDTSALGNLAMALCEQGRGTEALRTIDAALEIAPEDETNRVIRNLIRRSLPWWRRLLGRALPDA